MDKAYVDFKSLSTFHQAKSFWVSRPKGNIRFATIKHMETTNLKSRILEDSHIRLTGYKRLYPDNMRFIRVYDPDNDDIIDLISNNFEVGATEISALHRHRWVIEVFFKRIKQNITMKALWGYSGNAVKVHLWAAIIAYLTVARIKADYKSPYSITEMATLIRISPWKGLTCEP